MTANVNNEGSFKSKRLILYVTVKYCTTLYCQN